MSAACAEAFRPRPVNSVDERIELALVAPDQRDMRAEPRKQPGDGAPDAAGAARYHDDLVLQRIGCKHGRMNRELRVSQAEFRR